jgi:hypothetical protein
LPEAFDGGRAIEADDPVFDRLAGGEGPQARRVGHGRARGAPVTHFDIARFGAAEPGGQVRRGERAVAHQHRREIGIGGHDRALRIEGQIDGERGGASSADGPEGESTDKRGAGPEAVALAGTACAACRSSRSRRKASIRRTMAPIPSMGAETGLAGSNSVSGARSSGSSVVSSDSSAQGMGSGACSATASVAAVASGPVSAKSSIPSCSSSRSTAGPRSRRWRRNPRA